METPSISHFGIAIGFSFLFLCARFILDRFIFRKLATRLLSNGAPALKFDEATKSKINKCSESMWKLIYYATAESTVIIYAMSSIKIIYMCQCGFYTYSIAALLTWETRRKDFAVMMAHHVVTVILISYSYMTSFFRSGCIILALHDASDVFLEGAKVFKYSEKEFGASIFFGLFAISWLILRLIFFPFWVIRSTSYYLCEVLNLSESYHTALYYIFNTMLLTLLVFHIYWWILINAMIMRQLKNRGKVGEDIRSDDEN
ncbi:hypothetical protein Leryth_017038 [Lithospermum erythrorhizon]|nr:hypothetical protein Leryth_017038 [Lithospermum erythrorhizon]